MSISLRAPTVVLKSAGVAAELGAGAHLDLEVAGRELDLAAVLAHQHVGQDRQRVPPLDDAGHRLQGAEHFSCGAFNTIMSTS